MTAFYIKTKNMTLFGAVNALNIKLDYEKIGLKLLDITF